MTMDNTPVPEAIVIDSESGKTPSSDGWFIVNVADAQAMHTENFGAGTRFESMEAPLSGIRHQRARPGAGPTLRALPP